MGLGGRKKPPVGRPYGGGLAGMSVDLHEVSFFVEDEIFSFYFGFVGSFAHGISDFAGFGDLCAGVVGFYIGSNAGG